MHTTVCGTAGGLQQFATGGGEHWMQRHSIVDIKHYSRGSRLWKQHPGLSEGDNEPQAEATAILHTYASPRERDQGTVRPGDER